MGLPKRKQTNETSFFGVRLGSIAANQPLPFDIFLLVNNSRVLFRRRGDRLTEQRLRQLARHGLQEFLVPEDQRRNYLDSLRQTIKDPDTTTEIKSRVIKETAFIHVNDLFTKKNIRPVVNEAKSLVEEMVTFVSEDVSAVASLMHLSVHDYYTYNHCVDVAVYSIALAKRVFGNDKQLLFHAGMGGLLHDIGKRKISWDIINKQVPLTQKEWEEIKKHPEYGKSYLAEVTAVSDDSKRAVHQHHENFDGTGYPQGLEGEAISKIARIVSIADVFDALTTNRSYHKAVIPAEALKIMFSMQPGKFDPGLFKAFDKDFMKKGPIELPEQFDPCQTQEMVDSTWMEEKSNKKDS